VPDSGSCVPWATRQAFACSERKSSLPRCAPPRPEEKWLGCLPLLNYLILDFCHMFGFSKKNRFLANMVPSDFVQKFS
jgi:hypothetical protein